MPEREVRKFKPAVVRLGTADEQTRTDPIIVSEEEVGVFCGDCDKLIINNLCLLLSSETQAVVVSTRKCVWASKKDIPGRMIDGVFLRGRKKPTGTRANLTIVE
jgi:hypothetical protein